MNLTRLLPAAAAFALPALALAAEVEGGHEGEVSAIPSFAQAFIPAVFTLIIFGLLVAVLGKYAWGPISKGLEDREKKIRNDIEQAERARAEAEAKQREYADQLAGAEAKVRELMAEAQKNAEDLQQRTKVSAQTEAEDIKTRAMKDIDTSREQAVTQIRAETAELATLVARKILDREINAEDQRKLVDESLAQIDQLHTAGV